MDSRGEFGKLRSMTSWMATDAGSGSSPEDPPVTRQDAIAIAIRDALACRRCGLALVDDENRAFVRIDPAAGDDLANVALVCPACRREHGDHPEPMPAAEERVENIT